MTSQLRVRPGRPAAVEQVEHFGARLRELRQARRCSQAEAARELGVAVATYAAWERGAFAPRLEQLLALARWHAASLDYLLGRGSANGPPHTVGDLTWRLAWSQPSQDYLKGAAIWERLVRGDHRKPIADDLGLKATDLERHVQDLILSESLIVERVDRNALLERAVKQHFTDAVGGARLRDVWVANLDHIEWRMVRYVLLGFLAKELFRREVHAGDSVGLCGGFAVSRMVHELRRGECPGGIRVYPIAATPAFEKAAVSANSVVSALAYRHFDYGVQASELPFLFNELHEEGTRAASPTERIAKRILDDAARVDFVFMGVGSRETGALARDLRALQRDYQWLAKVDLAELRAAQPVGDILYHLVDEAGQPLQDFKERNEQLVCSIGLSGLRKLVDSGKRVVVIAGGPEKVDITRAAILGGYANVLVVDDGLARALTRPAPVSQRRDDR